MLNDELSVTYHLAKSQYIHLFKWPFKWSKRLYIATHRVASTRRVNGYIDEQCVYHGTARSPF